MAEWAPQQWHNYGLTGSAAVENLDKKGPKRGSFSSEMGLGVHFCDPEGLKFEVTPLPLPKYATAPNTA